MKSISIAVQIITAAAPIVAAVVAVAAPVHPVVAATPYETCIANAKTWAEQSKCALDNNAVDQPIVNPVDPGADTTIDHSYLKATDYETCIAKAKNWAEQSKCALDN
ncbi:hypothetical protein [Nodosilinea nodulosa]|uniref:hypothetical protein n=1 Tax=Nodosilinea nodulosa TaxID=416001 RepID=UPI0002D5BCF4|nr:hypothetical protein [Nodosilinea nodulosa]